MLKRADITLNVKLAPYFGELNFLGQKHFILVFYLEFQAAILPKWLVAQIILVFSFKFFVLI